MQTAHRYRRSPGMVVYWVNEHAVGFIWQTAQRIPLTTGAMSLLQRLADWTTVSELSVHLGTPGDVDQVGEVVALLHSLGLVEREDASGQPHHWDAWSPAAAFFHFSTKNGTFPEDLAQHDRELVEKAKEHPQPAPTRRIDGPRLVLPSCTLDNADLHDSLIARRTWRRFSRQPVPLAALGAVLKTTFGVQARGHVAGQGPVILRTSPSGGSRHPVEAYVLAWNVDGLPPGAYHFDSDSAELVDLQRPICAAEVPALLAHQTFFAQAAAAVIMCPVFARTQWRYGHSRAYRTVLLDAGHLGQTFCLAATALGLAPFTTMAFSEERLEQLLGLDGVSECPIYVAGVGMPDPDATRHPGRWSETPAD